MYLILQDGVNPYLLENFMAVYLYIVRHGEAEPMTKADELRQLTEHGKWEAKRTALWLKTQVASFDYVYASPYIRAQQTKDIILARGIEAQNEEVIDALTPEGDAKRVTDYVLANIDDNYKDAKKDTNIICVSHMPLVSYFIGELTGYTPIMATAGVAKIKLDLDKWNGLLETLLAPEQML
jgi:phosphohistidine phosphatase